MNSIEDLNNFANLVTYNDPRVTNVLFSKGTADNGTQTALEGQSVLAYYGIDIVEIRNYESVNISYTVNVSNLAGATLTFSDLPEHMSLANTATGIYVVTGFQSVFDWERVREPQINIPFDYSGTVTYSSSITYLSGQSKSWTTTLTVTDVFEWNTASPDNFWFQTGSNSIAGAPQMVDAANPVVSWYAVVVPSNPAFVSSFSSSGSGGTTEFDSVLKTYTINGTNSQINTHLASLVMVTNGEVQEHFTLTYRVTNINYGQTDSSVQNMKSIAIRYFTAMNSQNYDEDQIISITAPTISHEEAVGGETYTVILTPSISLSVDSITSAGSGGSTALNSTTKAYTIIGTKTQVNSHLSTISVDPGKDYTTNIPLFYSISISTGASQTRTKTLNIASIHDEVSNISSPRTFLVNQSNLIFATNTPQIIDTDPNALLYTVNLTVPSNTGTLSAPSVSSGTFITYTGTKAQVNTWIPQVTFTPGTNYFLNTTINYTQSKDGFTQLNNYVIDLLGPDVAFDAATASNQAVSTTEGATHSVPVGINIIGVNDYATTLPTYTINVSAVSGATVTWPTIPSGCVVTNPSTGVYRINGITNATIWNTIKQPTVRLPNAYFGTFNYTATISWNSSTESVAWTVTTTVTNVDLLTTTSDFVYVSGQTATLTGTPQLEDAGNQSPTYTVTVTPNITDTVSTMSSSGTGGTSSFNNTTKVLTLQGTLAQVNSRLNAISLTSAANNDLDYTLTYFAANNINSETDSLIQNLTSSNVSVLSAATANETYSLNTTAAISNGPKITDNNSNGLGVYTMNVYPSTLAAVSTLGNTLSPSYSDVGDQTTPVTISKNGEVIMIGANIYRRTANTNTWALEHTLTQPGDFNPSIVGQSFFDTGTNNANMNQIISPDGLNIAIGHVSQINTANQYEQGAVWIWQRISGTWTAQGKVTMPTWANITGVTTNAVNTNPYFGTNMDFSSDGSTLAVGAPLSSTANAGITGSVGGIVAVYTRSGSTWTRQTIIKNPTGASDEFQQFGGNPSGGDYNNRTIILSSTGNSMIVGRGAHDSIATYTRSGSTWTNRLSSYKPATWSSGIRLAASDDCRTVVIGSNFDSTARTYIVTFDANLTTATLVYTSDVYHTAVWCSGDGTEVISYAWSTPTRYVKLHRSTSSWSPTTLLSLTTGFTPLIATDALSTLLQGGNVYIRPTATYNAGTKTLTLRGSRAQVNSIADLITMTPSTGYNQNFQLYYQATTPTGSSTTRNQRVNFV